MKNLKKLILDWLTKLIRNKQTLLEDTQADQSEELSPKFLSLESKVFTQFGSIVYIGREIVNDEMRRRLRDEAKTMQKTELWEILNASVTNEAYMLALIQSKNFDEVVSSKMLHHWSHFMRNVINILAK